MRRFLFTSVTAVDTAIDRIDGLDHIVSIGAPKTAMPDRLQTWSQHPSNNLLRLEFDDLGLDFVRRKPDLQRMVLGDPNPIVLFSEDHARQLLAFGESVTGTVLVHCAAGLSRSPACAFVLAAQAFGPGQEDRAADSVARWPAGCGFPNTLIVHVADDVMGRQGAMRRAWVRKWYDRDDYDWGVDA
jgi:predicted protein tyrosine phosphatase